MACPYGAMEVVTRELSEQRALASTHVEAFKCDMCIHRAEGPACKEVCLTKAIKIIDTDVLTESLKKRREQAAVAL
jgi:electron transport protein HydN